MDWTQFWTGADISFSVILAITLLIMLYAMALISRQLRLMQYQISVIENDIKLIGEELKMLGSRDMPGRENGEAHEPD